VDREEQEQSRGPDGNGVANVVTFSACSTTEPDTTGGTPPTFPQGTSAPTPTQKTDPKSSTPPLTSQELKIQIVKKLQTQPGLNSREIHVKVSHDAVSLRGSVPTDNERMLAEAIAKSFSSNRRIDNRLVVK
jgi:osmotically-inducible protein OsmY